MSSSMLQRRIIHPFAAVKSCRCYRWIRNASWPGLDCGSSPGMTKQRIFPLPITIDDDGRIIKEKELQACNKQHKHYRDAGRLQARRIAACCIYQSSFKSIFTASVPNRCISISLERMRRHWTSGRDKTIMTISIIIMESRNDNGSERREFPSESGGNA